MSRGNFITQPFHNISNAIFMPFKAIFVVGLCWAINAFTFHGNWWVKWVALGMGIAVLVSFARAAKSLLLLALVAWAGSTIYKRYGAQARSQFDAWVAQTQPQAGQVLQAVRPDWQRNTA